METYCSLYSFTLRFSRMKLVKSWYVIGRQLTPAMSRTDNTLLLVDLHRATGQEMAERSVGVTVESVCKTRAKSRIYNNPGCTQPGPRADSPCSSMPVKFRLGSLPAEPEIERSPTPSFFLSPPLALLIYVTITATRDRLVVSTWNMLMSVRTVKNDPVWSYLRGSPSAYLLIFHNFCNRIIIGCNYR